MAKRKVISEEDNFEGEQEAERAPRPKRAAQNQSVKEESDSDYATKKGESNSDDDEEQAPLAKKSKVDTNEGKKVKKEASNAELDIVVKSTPEGDKYIELGKKKRVTVRSFKGTPLIDIREFYGADGEEKPGKKGISMTLEQWETLKNGIDTIDGLFVKVKK